MRALPHDQFTPQKPHPQKSFHWQLHFTYVFWGMHIQSVVADHVKLGLEVIMPIILPVGYTGC